MLTPSEITAHEFPKTPFNGYHQATVDDFFETVAADFAVLYKENSVLKQKLRVLVEKIEDYRATEENMRLALLAAQRKADEIVEDSKNLSAQMLAETDAEIKRRNREAAAALKNEEERLKHAVNQTSGFVTAAKSVLERHNAFLSEVQQMVFESVPAIKEAEAAAQQAQEEAAEEEADNTVAYEPKKKSLPKMEDEETGAVTEKTNSDDLQIEFDDLKFGYKYNFDDMED